MSPDYYDKLGVDKIINAAGTFTVLSSSLMPDVVQRAVAEAAKHPVRLLDLHRAAGVYLARRLQCEAALVTCGATSALTLATAACLTSAHPEIIHQIPLIPLGAPREVIIQRSHRADYDRAIAHCGIVFVEVESLEDYQAAFSPRTVMTHFFHAAEVHTISAGVWIQIAHHHSIPCLVDAAADVPPIANLWNLTRMGFDLAAFSGGKGIRGPQNTGLLLGRRDLVEAACNNASPFDGTVGRGMKVAKEQIIGLVAAVDWFLTQSDEQIEKECLDRANAIASQLRHLPSLRVEIATPPVANHVPHLLLHYDRASIPIDPLTVAARLAAEKPVIELHPATGGQAPDACLPAGVDTIVVGVWMLEPGQETIVARRLLQILTEAIQPEHET